MPKPCTGGGGATNGGNQSKGETTGRGGTSINGPNGAKKGKPRGIRKDRDCFTCRARDVKCDLNRPYCTPCVRDNLVCGGYPARIVWNPPIEGGIVKPRPRKHSVTATEPTHTTAPAITAYQLGTASSPDMSSSPPTTMSPPVRVAIKDTAKAAVSSQITFYNNGGTVQQSPTTPSVEATRALEPKPSLLDSFELISAPSDPSDEQVDPMEITNFSWGIKAIMKAFAHACQNDSRMETHEAIEKSQILSMTWRFVSACLGQADGSELTALEVRTNAIEELQHLVNRGVLEAIFSILAFTYLDVCQGSFGVWHRHLKGARSLLDLHCADREKLYAAFSATPGLQQAVTLLCWYDLMGSLALNRPLIFENWHREAIEDSFFTLVNCPREVLLQFQDLQSTVSTCDPAGGDISDEILIKSIGIAAAMPIDCPTAVVAANNIWRLAALLVTMWRRFGHNVQPSVQLIVRKIFALLERVPNESAISQHLAVIVFVTSRFTQDETQRDMVRNYWRFWASETFPLYPDALQQCEQLWAAQAPTL